MIWLSYMKRKPIQPLTREQLEALPTKALLGRLKRLYNCEESFEFSDKDESEVDANTIQFKDTPQWQRAYKELKEVLSIREHLPKGKEAKEIRLGSTRNKRRLKEEAKHFQKCERSFNVKEYESVSR